MKRLSTKQLQTLRENCAVEAISNGPEACINAHDSMLAIDELITMRKIYGPLNWGVKAGAVVVMACCSRRRATMLAELGSQGTDPATPVVMVDLSKEFK